MKKTRNIALIGDFYFSLTASKNLEKGIAPSLAIAQHILDVTVKLLNPAKKRFTHNNIVIAKAPAVFFFPVKLVKDAKNMFTTV